MSIPGPWTYSMLESFQSCPKKHYHLRVIKDTKDDPAGEALLWGRAAHTAFENRIKYNTPLATGMQRWESMAKKLLALPGEKHVEIKLAIDNAFQPVGWKQAWSRGAADLLVLNGKQAAVVDYKTGKFRPSDQLRLYSAYTFATYPEIEEVQTAYVWLKERKVTRETVTRATVPAVWQEIMPAVRKLEQAYEKDNWPARPSGLCKAWCPVISCEFNGRRAS